MSHHTWNYQRALRAAGYRVTHQRELVMDVICESGGRLSAREVCTAVRTREATVNDATVYRNLHFLSERGLIRPVEQQGQTHYELAGPNPAHHHLVCRGCGAEREVHHDVTDAFYGLVEERFGFRVTSDHLVLEGLCEACVRSSGTNAAITHRR